MKNIVKKKKYCGDADGIASLLSISQYFSSKTHGVCYVADDTASLISFSRTLSSQCTNSYHSTVTHRTESVTLPATFPLESELHEFHHPNSKKLYAVSHTLHTYHQLYHQIFASFVISFS